MKLYGLIGYPLSHSFSKKYFDKKFVQENILNCTFSNFELPSIGNILSIIQQNPAMQGFAVTIPYKQLILNYLNDATDSVKKILACNCVKITDGVLYGYNTDVFGFEKSFVQKLQSHHTKALVLGNGGAAQAVLYVLNKLAIPYTVVTRKASHQTIVYESLDKAMIEEHSIIINTTPLGTYPAIHNCPNIPYEYITNQHYLFDLVYNPAETLFLLKGKQQGATTKNGMDMLAIQAEENWKIWND